MEVFNHITMQSLLWYYHRLPLLHMAKHFIWIEETKERINEFSIEYMINPILNINKSFKEQVTKCIKAKFGAITQPHINKISAKNNTRVLALLMSYETRKILRKFSKC